MPNFCPFSGLFGPKMSLFTAKSSAFERAPLGRPTPPSALPRPPARPPKRTNPQIEKHHHHTSRHQKRPMIGPFGPTGSDSPERGGKYDNRQQEEDARNFKPQSAANPPERPQKAGNAACDARSRPSGHLPGAPPFGASLRNCSRRCWRSRAGPGDALPGNPPRNSQSDAQGASNGLSSHFDMMVAVKVGALLFTVSLRFTVAPKRNRK